MAEVTRQNGLAVFDLRTDPPLKEFQFSLSRFSGGISDWSGYFRSLGEWFQAAMVRQFATEGKDTGEKWEPLSPRYAKWKAKHYKGRTIGIRTSALMSSMMGGGGYSEQISETEASFGMSSTSEAAAYGAHFSARRPVVRFTEKQGRETQKLAHEWIMEEMRGVLGGVDLPGRVRSGNYTGSALRQTGG